MTTKEIGLTGLALSLLAFWELSIGEIPLGLYAISHADKPLIFGTIILLKLLLASILISRSLMKHFRSKPHPLTSDSCHSNAPIPPVTHK